MAKFVWLASYPRSGNTWLRFALSCLLAGKPMDHSAEVSRLIPDIHDGLRGDVLFGKKTTIIKTHWAFNTGLPLREDVVGVIHLVRNPLDVLVSNQNYAMTRSGALFNQANGEERENIARKFADNYIGNGGHENFRSFGIGSWEEHTLSWLSPLNVTPKLLVRYEDLVAKPDQQLSAIARFLGLKRSDSEIVTACENSSVDMMRQLETREVEMRADGIFYQSVNAAAYEAGQRLIVGGERKFDLTLEQQKRATERFGPLMKRLGYKLERSDT